MRPTILLILISFCALSLGACGQAGPLFLPDEAEELELQKP